VAPLTADQLNAGVVVPIDPPGDSKVATPGAGGAKVTVNTAFAVLLDGSCAVIVTTVVPAWSDSTAIDHAVVPVATPLPPRSVVQLTRVTPTLSLAVPLSASGLLVAV
jgi:hypothetical protein